MYYTAEERERYHREQEELARQRVLSLAEGWEARAEDLSEYLRFASRFPQYSARNTMLIYRQRPGACFVASMREFNKMGYIVHKGERGIEIRVPHMATYYRIKESSSWHRLTRETPDYVKKMIRAGMIETEEKLLNFRKGTVFDITQTNCPRADYPKLVGLGYDDAQHAAIYDIVRDYCQSCKMGVREFDFKSISKRGFYVSNTNEIFINTCLGDTQRISTLLHEMAHGLLMHNAADEKSIAQREFEADALSIMLEEHLGVPITETRKAHVRDAYQAYVREETDKLNKPEEIKELKECVDRLFVPVNSLYAQHSGKLAKLLTQARLLPQRELTADTRADEHKAGDAQTKGSETLVTHKTRSNRERE